MSKQKKTRILVQSVFFTSLLYLITACGGGGGSDTSNSLNNAPGNTNNTTTGTQLVLSGSVGDGPITGATITVKAADGTILATTVSDTTANYRVMVPDNAAYPYTVTATSGIDMVTGTAPTFSMTSVVTGPSNLTANINPFSTLVVRTAQFMAGGLTAANLNLANQNIREQLNFGLDTSLVPNPGSTPITDQNVAVVVKASETLAEMIRRTHTALQATGDTMDQDGLIWVLAADMTDGFLDGMGTTGALPRVAAIANIVSGQVIIEALSNNLKVNGVWATDLLDNAIRTSIPGTVATSADVRATEEILMQAKAAIAAAQAIAPSTALVDVAALLETLTPGTTPESIETVLSPDTSDSLSDATILATTATSTQLTTINSASNQRRKNAPPKVSLTAEPASVAYNGTTTLSWTSSNAVSCSAVEGWSATHATSGSMIIGPLTTSATYTLNCINVNSQITSASVSVTVGSPPPVVTDPAPVDGGNDPVPGDTSSDPAPGDTGSEPIPSDGGTTPAPEENEPLTITNINPTNYIWDTLELGKLLFVDRDSIYTEIPERYVGMDQIRTAKNDQNTMGDNFVSFSVNIPVTVYVAHHDDIINKPAWLQSWTDTGDTLVSRSIFKKDFQAGTIILGGNTIDGVSGTGSMYMILIEPVSGNTGSGTSQKVSLTLSWAPNPDQVTGYIVYSGPTADSVTQLSDISLTSAGFNANTPSIEYNIVDDLGLSQGEQICFKLRAYNDAVLSNWSSATCSVI